MFVGPCVSHIDWFVLHGVDKAPPRRGRALRAPGVAAEFGHVDHSSTRRLPDRSPDRPRRLGNKGARSDAPQGARGIERFSMRRLKQQKCKVDGKSPYFRSPTKVERASLALRLVVLPPDGPPRQPGRTGAAPRSEIGRRGSLTPRG